MILKKKKKESYAEDINENSPNCFFKQGEEKVNDAALRNYPFQYKKGDARSISDA